MRDRSEVSIVKNTTHRAVLLVGDIARCGKRERLQCWLISIHSHSFFHEYSDRQRRVREKNVFHSPDRKIEFEMLRISSFAETQRTCEETQIEALNRFVVKIDLNTTVAASPHLRVNRANTTAAAAQEGFGNETIRAIIIIIRHANEKKEHSGKKNTANETQKLEKKKNKNVKCSHIFHSLMITFSVVVAACHLFFLPSRVYVIKNRLTFPNANNYLSQSRRR